MQYNQQYMLHIDDLVDPESTQQSDEQSWQKLEKLTDHRHDALALVAEQRFAEESLTHLATANTRNSPQTSIYVTLTATGKVIAGSVVTLAEQASQSLADFDPLRHTVIALFVNAQHRTLGDRLDVWIIAHDYLSGTEQPSVIAYHGLVWVNQQGKICLQPAYDDGSNHNTGAWPAQTADHLGDWLKDCCFVCNAQADPFSEPTNLPKASIIVTACAKTNTCAASQKKIYACDKTQIQPLQLKRTITGLTLTDNTALQGVAACSDHNLIGFARPEQLIQHSWKYVLKAQPEGLAFIPAEKTSPDDKWPDLLVACNDGTLLHLRHLAEKSLEQVWEKHWRCLGLGSAQALLEKAKTELAEGVSISRQKALLQAVMIAVLAEASNTNAAIREKWLEPVSVLFGKATATRVQSHAIKPLLCKLREYAKTGQRWSLVDPNSDFRSRLLYQIYDQYAQFSVREQIDGELRILNAGDSEILAQDPDWKKLIKRTERTRLTIWNKGAPSKDKVKAYNEYLGIAINRWANAYIPAATIFHYPDLPHEGLPHIAGFQFADGKPGLAVARQNKVLFYDITADGELSVRDSLQAESSGQIQRLRVFAHGNRPSVPLTLVLLSQNKLEICQKKGNRMVSLPPVDLSDYGQAYHLVACRQHDGDAFLIAVLYQRQARAFIALWRLGHDGTSCELSRISTELLHTRTFTLAPANGGGYWLAIGSAKRAPCCLYRLDDSGKVNAQHWFRTLNTGAAVIRFDQPESPRFAVVAERNGMLWCLDLEQIEDSSADLRWCYQSEKPLRGLVSISLDGQPHFLTGLSSGGLTLLRAQDGRRVWQGVLGQAVRYLTMSGPFAVVLTENNQMTTLVPIERQQQAGALSIARDGVHNFEQEQLQEGTDVHHLDVFAKLISNPNNALALLQNGTVRRARARIVAYLAKECQDLPDNAAKLLQQLSFRELILLINYLPDDKTHWDALIIQELRQKNIEPSPGDTSARAAMTAYASYLQRLGRQKPTISTVIEQQPPPKLLEFFWLRVEYARILMQAIRSDTRGNAPALFQRLIACVLENPLELTITDTNTFAYDSELQKAARALARLLSAVQANQAVRPKDLRHLQTLLAANTKYSNEWSTALTAFIELHLIAAENADADWRKWRQQALTAILRVTQHAVRASSEAIRTLKLKEPMPDDQQPFDTRLIWMDHAARELDQAATAYRYDQTPWVACIDALVRRCRALIQDLLKRERRHILRQVRARISQIEPKWEENNRLQLQVNLALEGWRRLDDVTIHITCQGEHGLQPPGANKMRLEIPFWPGADFQSQVDLNGYVRPGQRQLTITTQLIDNQEKHPKEEWPIDLLDPPSFGPWNLAQSLPQLYQRFRAKLFKSSAAVMIAVLDQKLGQGMLCQDWDERHPQSRLDLDQAVREYGKGRYYSAKPLSFELLKQHLEQALQSCQHSTLLIGPVDETLQRATSDGEAPELLDQFLEWLRQRATQKTKPQLIVLVASAHACLLRRLDLGAIQEVPVQHLLHGKTTELIDTGLRTKLVDLIIQHTQLEPTEASRCAEQLGHDPRLVIEWLRRAKSDRQSNLQILQEWRTSDELAGLVRSELRSLDAVSLFCAIVGTEAQTTLLQSQVKPDLIAAEDYFSTTRKHEPKRLQAKGAVFSRESLERLRSDARPPTHLAVQGFGTVGTVDGKPEHFFGLLQHFSQERRASSFTKLANSGIGSWRQSIFRTGSPYRECIRDCYSRHAAKAEGERNAAVYRDLAGSTRTPLEVLDLSELGDWSPAQLQGLLPRASETDLARLRKLAQLYARHSEAHPEQTLRTLLEPERVSIMQRQGTDSKRWDAPLLALPWVCYGSGMAPNIERSEHFYPNIYWYWFDEDQNRPYALIGKAIDDAAKRRLDIASSASQNSNTSDPAPPSGQHLPRVVLLGPGAETLSPDPERRVARIRLLDACQAAWEGDLVTSLQRKILSQLRLTTLSPFQTSGALLPGSDIFVGRDEELEFIYENVRKRSILIVGGRRVGKTSLLNQVFNWAQSQADLEPIKADLQAADTSAELRERLKQAETRSDDELREGIQRISKKSKPRSCLADIARFIRQRRRLPVFLFNEIDALAQAEPDTLQAWRGLHDQGLARFVMVGYAVLAQLRQIESPFFHFTEGRQFDGKALALTELSEHAAQALLDRLESSNLQLIWRSQGERQQAYTRLLERSYCIPWVLQRYAQLLVERLEQDRRAELCLADVDAILSHDKSVVWNYFANIDYRSLSDPSDPSDPLLVASGSGLKLILYLLVRQHYLLGGAAAPIRNPKLKHRSPLDSRLGFTVGQAEAMLKKSLNTIPLNNHEKSFFLGWLNRLDLAHALQLATLTLILEPDPKNGDRYGFLLHMFPLELHYRFGENDPELIDLILNQLIDFIGFIR